MDTKPMDPKLLKEAAAHIDALRRIGTICVPVPLRPTYGAILSALIDAVAPIEAYWDYDAKVAKRFNNPLREDIVFIYAPTEEKPAE